MAAIVAALPAAGALIPTTVPEALRDLPGWLVWRFEGDNRKVPFYVDGGRRHGRNGSPEDARQLTTFERARSAALKGNFHGVGFAPFPEFGIVALDFDHCVNDQGEVLPEVLDVVSTGYAELSPSGKGVRAFVRGNLTNRKSSAKKHAFGFEVFSTKGWVTLTGRTLLHVDADAPLPDISEQLKAFCAARWPAESEDRPTGKQEPLGLSDADLEELLDAIDPDTDHDEWLRVGMALHHETQGEGFALWDDWSSHGEKYPSTDELRKRWDSFGGNAGAGVTARTLIKVNHAYDGNFQLSRVATADDFDVVAGEASAKQEGAKASRFERVPLGEFCKTWQQATQWWVRDLIPKAGLVVLFGESGSGKSFMALDLVGAIAQGKEWRGHRVRQGAVVYVCAEGANGFRVRAEAYRRHKGEGVLAIDVIAEAPNFLQKKDVSDLVKAVKASGEVGVIVIDTLARVTPGANENSSEDLGLAIAHCDALHRATGATVVLIHHSGKDASKGARGWSGLRAAADAELEVLRTPVGRVLKVAKQKDGDDQGEYGFALEQVTLGFDEEGLPITSCVVVETEITEAVPTKPLGPLQQALIQAYRELQAAGQPHGFDDCRRKVADGDSRVFKNQKKNAQFFADWVAKRG